MTSINDLIAKKTRGYIHLSGILLGGKSDDQVQYLMNQNGGTEGICIKGPQYIIREET